MTEVTTLGSRVRLIVIQFLMKTDLIPPIVPPQRKTDRPAVPAKATGGRCVLQSTKEVYLLNLLDGICPITGTGPYELVAASHSPNERWGMSMVKYVLCHKNHVEDDKLYSEFVAKRNELIESLVSLACDNIWAVQGHLNPYWDTANNCATGEEVLVLGCAGRNTLLDPAGRPVTVYKDGRKYGTDGWCRGVGPKILLRDRAKKMIVADSSVQLI